jgi:hypothetical protein
LGDGDLEWILGRKAREQGSPRENTIAVLGGVGVEPLTRHLEVRSRENAIES